VFQSDIIWTAEFVRQNWLLDLTKYVESRQSEFIPATLAPMKYGGRYWGVPQVTGAGLLYYRTDQVSAPPATWQALYADAKADSGFVYQGAPYEGLTCDFLELAFAAGGQVLSPDGKKAVIDSPQNLKALQLMVDGVKNGTAANGVTTYMEEEARRYWESGKATFMRNWGYAYALGEKASAIKGKFAVAPLPSFEGGGTAGILGGASPVISTYSKNPKGAVEFIDFFTSPQIDKQNAVEFALPPVLKATYDDPAVKKAIPFSAQLEQAIEQAKPRPVSPVYPQISQAIYKNVNSALAGHETPAAALKAAQTQIEKALNTF
jgi:multiple sugar transport system substrate-binding protein